MQSVRSGKGRRACSMNERVFFIGAYTVIVLLTLLVLYPLVYIVASSFSSPEAVTTGKVILWPVDFSLEGYKRVWADSDIWRAYANTLLYESPAFSARKLK